MCLFKRRKKEQMMISQINNIIEGTDYKLILYKKDYKHFGNSIIKFACQGRMNIKIITDRSDIIFDDKTYPMTLLGDITKVDRDTLILKFIDILFNIVKSDDWRLTGQESYLLFTKVKKILPKEYIDNLEKPELFHEHCSFCWDKVEENKDKKHYCTLDNYHWICNDCYNDFKELLKLEYFEILGKMTHKGMILDSLIDDDECFTQIKEYFNLSEVNITDNDLERTLKEMVEEGYISINFKWQNENNEYSYSLTEKGRKVWKEKNNM